MFSVLIFLLTYLLAIGSRKKALKAGLIFTATTFVVYFLLMFGIIKVIDVLAIEKYARGVIVVIALVAGLIMVKDFFFYGKWISLEISARFKPTIERLIKRGTIPSAILLALLSSIVELPCTSVLPLAYAGVLTSRDLSVFWPLILYNIFFVLPLLVIIVAVTFAWAKVENFEQMRVKYRKFMRLGAGLLLLLLALAFWTGVL
jgi:cytochrome c biogenesis protein CcdA